GHHEEVRAETHLLDDAQLVAGPGPALIVITAWETAVHPGPDFLAEPALLGLALRQREVRHQVRLGELHLGPLDDQQRRVAASLPLRCGADRAHLLRALEVEAGALELEPARVS